MFAVLLENSIMKLCKKCNNIRSLSDYRPDKRHSDGKQSNCKYCQDAYMKKWLEKNRDRKNEIDRNYANNNIEKNRERSLNWTRKNPEKNRVKAKKWAKENPENMAKIGKKWRKNNKGKINALSKKRYTRKLNATPSWLTKEHFNLIEEIYILSQKITQETDIKHAVDHIVPLKGKNVCGLHVPWNLRVITWKENRLKSNKF